MTAAPQDITTLANVRRQLATIQNGVVTMGTLDDDLIQQYVTNASDAIQSACRRNFYDSIGTLTYDAYYPVVANRELYLGQDLIGIVSIVNGAAGTMTPDQYRLLPINYNPKYAVEILISANTFWQPNANGYYQNAIQVVGTLGYCTSANRPTDITLAATKLAAYLYQTRNDNDMGVVRQANGDYLLPPKVPTIVQQTIDKYIRREIYVGGEQ